MRPLLIALLCCAAAARPAGALTARAVCGPTLAAAAGANTTASWAVGAFKVKWYHQNASLSAYRTGTGKPPVFANVPGAAFIALGCGPKVRRVA